MTATVRDYDIVLEDLLNDIGRIQDAVSSAVLFGSMARGDVLPGHSDMMDVYVFLGREVFSNKEQFLNALEVMAQACEKIADRSPGPFHPFFYWSETDPVPATFHLDLAVHSKVIFGDDSRSQIKTTPSSIAVARTAFFEMRRLGGPLMAYLHKKELSGQDCEAIFNLLMAIKRDLPMLALMVLDIWVVQKESIQALREALPDIDTMVLDRIVTLQHDESARLSPGALLKTFRDAMTFVEDLNDRLIVAASANLKSS
ncbi:MAG TPA: nucleotidyltransferase domain-containing protein [Blastocatellia bacterium]